MKLTVNNYPIGWEWLANVPLEDFNWLIDIFATIKCLDISSEREYMNQYTDIRILTNEIKPC